MAPLWPHCRQQLARSRRWQIGFVLAGIIIGQLLLYGRCLLGAKILLPLDTLVQRGIYVPRTPELQGVRSFDDSLSDLIYFKEPLRRFAASELHAGRVPMWWPDQYAGAPYVLPRFSPFALLQGLVESPIVLAWSALAGALVAGLGAYAFCRRVLGLGYFAAAVAANCYPLTGFLVLWQGYGLELSACWLPWVLLAVDQTIRARSRRGPIQLSLATFLVLASGQLDVGVQVLLISGAFAVWVAWDEFGQKLAAGPVSRSFAKLVAGWGLGMLLAAPHVLPLIEYAHTGYRMDKRTSGIEERPPVGLAALPMLVLPDQYGRSTRGSVLTLPFGPGNVQESAAGGYGGVVALLAAVPLAFWSRRHRRISYGLLAMGALGMGWVLDVPGLVDLLRLPGLNTMSHNRLVFATAFAIVALTAIGLQALADGVSVTKSRHWLLALPGIGLCGWCVYRVLVPPEAISSTLPNLINTGQQVFWLRDMTDVQEVLAWYAHHFVAAAALAGIAAGFWILIGRRSQRQMRLTGVLAIALVADLLWFAYGRCPQSDPALYYPRVRALEQISQAAPGRIIGFNCLPANLASMAGLRDVRGCDGVDPKELIELLTLTTSQPSTYEYAVAQLLIPATVVTTNGTAQLHPALDMLGVRYVILREEPPTNARPIFASPDYWVLENPKALPRLFVPQRVVCVPDKTTRLNRIGDAGFDASATSLVEETVTLPNDCRGKAVLQQETPTQIRVQADLETDGLVVLTDRWDRGWRAYRNGVETPLLRVNQAVRGVVAPPGQWQIEFRYEPARFKLGLWLAALGAAGLAGWTGVTFRQQPAKMTLTPT